jgi:hypothetical protein
MAPEKKSSPAVFPLRYGWPHYNRLDRLTALESWFKQWPQCVPHSCRGLADRNHGDTVEGAQVVRELPNVKCFALVMDASSHDIFNAQMSESVEKNTFGRLA